MMANAGPYGGPYGQSAGQGLSGAGLGPQLQNKTGLPNNMATQFNMDKKVPPGQGMPGMVGFVYQYTPFSLTYFLINHFEHNFTFGVAYSGQYCVKKYFVPGSSFVLSFQLMLESQLDEFPILGERIGLVIFYVCLTVNKTR